MGHSAAKIGRLGVGPAWEEPDPDRPLTLSAAVEFAKDTLEGVRPLWLEAEVSSWKVSHSGHCYITLRDESTVAEAVMYRSVARRLPSAPPEGATVLALVQASLYQPHARFQLVVQALRLLDSNGLQRLALEHLKRRLEAEGLFGLNRKRKLPPFPRRIAVVTSPSAAAWHDVVEVVGRRAPSTQLVLVPTRVQGPEADAEIAAAIRRACAHARADVLIVTRGGGGEELRCFDSEAVARAIAASSIPVVTAIGHASDVTVADLVADVRAPTPSAAAELVTPESAEVARRLSSLQGQMVGQIGRIVSAREAQTRRFRSGLGAGISRRLQQSEASLDALRSERLQRGLMRMVDRWSERVDRVRADELQHRALRLIAGHEQCVRQAGDALQRSVNQILAESDQRLRSSAARLHALSPLAVLGRGYSVTRGGRGHIVHSINQVRVGEVASVHLSDGSLQAQIRAIHPVDRQVLHD